MKIFKCNSELAAILTKNGFVNTTSKEYPDHADKPDGKRIFRLGPKAKSFIKFDYITLKSYPLQMFETSVNEEQLKALICFHKLHHRSQHGVQAASGGGLPGVVKLIEDLKSGTSYIRRAKPQLAKNVMQVYESVTL